MKRLALLLALSTTVAAQTSPPDLAKSLEAQRTRNDRSFEDTQRMVDDAMWYFRLGDIADIDKFEIASSKPRREKNPTDQNAGNALIFSEIYQNAPGAHRFNRIDTKLAKESRQEMWDFLARHLK